MILFPISRVPLGDSSFRFMVTEAYSNIEHMIEYYGNSTHNGADSPFNFLLITYFNKTSTANQLQDVIHSWYTRMPKDKWANWVVSIITF